MIFDKRSRERKREREQREKENHLLIIVFDCLWCGNCSFLHIRGDPWVMFRILFLSDEKTVELDFSDWNRALHSWYQLLFVTEHIQLFLFKTDELLGESSVSESALNSAIWIGLCVYEHSKRLLLSGNVLIQTPIDWLNGI